MVAVLVRWFIPQPPRRPSLGAHGWVQEPHRLVPPSAQPTPVHPGGMMQLGGVAATVVGGDELPGVGLANLRVEPSSTEMGNLCAEGLSASEVGKEIAEHREHAEHLEHTEHAPAEHAQRDRWVAIVEAVLLSVVALLAAWSGYSAAKWGTESRFRLRRPPPRGPRPASP